VRTRVVQSEPESESYGVGGFWVESDFFATAPPDVQVDHFLHHTPKF